MKIMRFLLAGAAALALLGVASCKSGGDPIAPDETPDQGFDEEYYAGQATVASDDEAFKATESGAEVLLAGEGGEVLVKVSCGVDWTVVNDGEGWLDAGVDVSAGTLTLSADENTEKEQRSATVVVATAESGIQFAAITVTQAGRVTYPLIMVLTTDEDGTETALPLFGTVDCVVDWGDGTVDAVTDVMPKHTYAAAGEYEVSVDGTVTALNSENIWYYNYTDFITGVKSWGLTGLTDMTSALEYCKKVKSLPTDELGSFAEVTTFEYAFHFTDLDAIPEGLFAHASKASSFSGVFRGNWNLASVPAGLFDNCAAATDFSYAFYTCYKVASIPPGLFAGCPEATKFSYVLSSTALEEIPEGLFDNCPDATDFEEAFSDTPITVLPVSLFDKCLKAVNFCSTFSDCYYVYTESPYTEIEGERVHLYERENHPDIFASGIDGTECFSNCFNMTDYRSMPEEWTGYIWW